MNRREFLANSVRIPAGIFIAGSLLDINGCGSASSLTQPTSTPVSTPSAPLDKNKVGARVYSVVSPKKGNFYYDILPTIKNISIATRKFDKDRITGVALNGYAITSINGDYGPAMVNALGENTNTGWIMIVGNNHLFVNSIMDVEVEANDPIDFYYGLPCSNPSFCG